MLAHALEAAGLATVGLSLVRRQAENIRAPRMLHCQFPLGRPLGLPGDADFQLDVLRRAFALLARMDVPVLVDHPATIADEADAPLACTLPPRFDASLPPAVDEAHGLRGAYDRQLAASGRTLVGRVADADHIDELITTFIAVADGGSLDDVGWKGHTALAASQDVRAYYEEAALALADHVPGAHQAESWFYGSTATGKVLIAARAALKAGGADANVWGFLAPGSQR